MALVLWPKKKDQKKIALIYKNNESKEGGRYMV